MMHVADRVYENFYKVPRIGSRVIEGVTPLSDGGGPFGFDINSAESFDYLVNSYNPDVIIEAGSHVGDTTEYLGRMYSLPIYSCDVVPEHHKISQKRVARYPNVQVSLEDSRALLARIIEDFSTPLLFLDSHWGEDWPLIDELKMIKRGIVVIDDFYTGDPRYGYDTYQGTVCGPEMLRAHGIEYPLYVNSSEGPHFQHPCQQLGRRAGHGYLLVNVEDKLKHNRMFRLPDER